jgi:hypothetical protein
LFRGREREAPLGNTEMLEARVGIEPTNKGFRDLGVTTTFERVFNGLDGGRFGFGSNLGQMHRLKAAAIRSFVGCVGWTLQEAREYDKGESRRRHHG